MLTPWDEDDSAEVARFDGLYFYPKYKMWFTHDAIIKEIAKELEEVGEPGTKENAELEVSDMVNRHELYTIYNFYELYDPPRDTKASDYGIWK